MATRGEVGDIREHSSNVVQDYTCSTCSKSGKTTEASHYCPDCDVCYCKACLCDHVVIGRSKVDQWGKGARGAGETGGQSDGNEEVKCLRHPENEVELYCVDHDVLCCRMCPSTDHRSCKDMQKISAAAAKDNLDQAIQSIPEEISNLKRKAEYLGEDSIMKKRFTESSHTNYVSKLREMRRKINANFDQITQEADNRKQHYIDKFNTDQLMCKNIIDKLPTLEKALEPLGNKQRNFMNVKRTREWVEQISKEMEHILKIEVTGVFKNIPQAEETNALNAVTDVITIRMVDMKFTVATTEDEKECEIVGICQIASGNMVLADQANKCLKQLDGAYTIINHYAFLESPRGVCAVGEAEVAVAMENNKVLIVAVGTQFDTVRSFDMNHVCSQVEYRNEHFYIAEYVRPGCLEYYSCKKRVHTYDKCGNAIRVYETPTTSNHQCSNYTSGHVATSQDGQKVFVACPDGCITALDLEGNKIAESSEFTSITGLCVDEHEYLYISDRSSQEVIKLSQTGTEGFEKIKTVMSSGRGPTAPSAICYDKNLGRVAICAEKGDYVYLA